MNSTDAPLWSPSPDRIARARITAFMRHVESEWNVAVTDYPALYTFSIERPEAFWKSVWNFCRIRGNPGDRVVADLDRMPGSRFFPDARLNFAENVLRQSGDGAALIFNGEGQRHQIVSHDALRAGVARFASALRAEGVTPGDRVAGYVPNMPEAIVASLGTAAVGAVWSSCSPDFGVQGVLDRFGQIEPKVLLTADGYWYGGKQFDSIARVAEFSAKLPSLQQILVFPYLSDKPDLSKLPKGKLLPEALASHPGGPIQYERVPFNHPLYIMYSSGTTGVPKCIVHGQGGTLLQHLKEHRLHGDVRPHDRVF